MKETHGKPANYNEARAVSRGDAHGRSESVECSTDP